MKSPNILSSSLKAISTSMVACTLIGLISCQAYGNGTCTPAAVVVALAKTPAQVNIPNLESRCIDDIRDCLKKELKDDPRALALYAEYDAKFEKLLFDFLDQNNSEPIAAHVPRFDNILKKFKQEIIDSQAHARVKKITEYVHTRFTKLVDVFRAPNATLSDIVSKLPAHKAMLPKTILQKIGGYLALMGCLRNRLKRSN